MTSDHVSGGGDAASQQPMPRLAVRKWASVLLADKTSTSWSDAVNSPAQTTASAAAAGAGDGGASSNALHLLLQRISGINMNVSGSPSRSQQQPQASAKAETRARATANAEDTANAYVSREIAAFEAAKHEWSQRWQRRIQLLATRKPVVVICARAHPGETVSSWVCEGIVSFLLSEHPVAVSLRKDFVFMVKTLWSNDDDDGDDGDGDGVEIYDLK